MPKFQFAIDREYTMWDRWRYNIEADTYEDAVDKMREEFHNPLYEDDNGEVNAEVLYDSYYLTDKEELIYLQEDGNEDIIEIKH